MCIRDSTRDYAFPGIGVSIFPLRTPAASVKAERRLSRDENAWTELCHINYADRNFRSRVNRTIMRLQCMITGRQGQAAHLYDRLVRSCQQPGANKYILKRRKQTTVFPAEIFAESKRVTLELSLIHIWCVNSNKIFPLTEMLSFYSINRKNMLCLLQ